MPNNKNFKSSQRKGSYEKKKANGVKTGTPKPNTQRCDLGDGITSTNDIKWYSQYPELMKAAASVQYSNALGLPVKAGNDSATPSVIPGIMKISYLPSIGAANSDSDPINVAARLIYSFIRHANSGSKNYEAPDYFMYLLAVGSLHTFASEMWRIYGLLNVYSVKNRYINKPIVEALGYDFDDIVANLASFRYYIDYFAAKVNTFAVPKNVMYFDRCTYLPLHVFKDSNNEKAQMYVFSPMYYYKWNGTISETGSALVTADLGTSAVGAVKYADIVAFGNSLIDSLMYNEDLGIMSGDTLKAFGTEGVRQLKMVDDKYYTIPFFDEGILGQIHNLTIAPTPTIDDDSITISQTAEGTIVQTFNFADTPAERLVTLPLLDSGMENPTPEFTMEATRLMSIYSATQDEKVSLVTSGTEIVCDVRVFNLLSNGSVNLLGLPVTQQMLYVTDIDTAMNALVSATCWSKFDWAPSLYIGGEGASLHQGDLFNYTTVDGTVVGRIHDTALQSLFNTIGLIAQRTK